MSLLEERERVIKYLIETVYTLLGPVNWGDIDRMEAGGDTGAHPGGRGNNVDSRGGSVGSSNMESHPDSADQEVRHALKVPPYV